MKIKMITIAIMTIAIMTMLSTNVQCGVWSDLIQEAIENRPTKSVEQVKKEREEQAIRVKKMFEMSRQLREDFKKMDEEYEKNRKKCMDRSKKEREERDNKQK